MKTLCLLCNGEIESEFTWRSLFNNELHNSRICQKCHEKFESISGETCDICGRPFSSLDAEYRNEGLCLDCRRWEEDEFWNGSLDKNTSLYSYSSVTKEVIARFKFRGDYVLAEVFAEDFLKSSQAWQYDYIVPIPLSEERLYERGFNQSEAIIRAAGLKPTQLLSRVHTEKQSKKSRSERIHLDQVFRADSDLDLRGKKILLVDDIYTTGSTLRHAARLLKENGAGRVYSLTLAR
ncbi:ComF family protein [Mesobacillus jeotgali]|uniref:ComF family protein n=1 Tax=Mesobacillus jeotgali TaxID=129985 RepID=A0ABY9VNR6_9BACI|nr:ComF family protein [Mesobacillus jeotgali]WNF22621.1 ComF family protein [Mesobacillus jeotgali]